MKLYDYTPSFQPRSGVQNEDATAYIDRIMSEPCGTDNVKYSAKSGKTSAVSLAAAGQILANTLVREENAKRKYAAFASRFPEKAELIPFDADIKEEFRVFNEYPKTDHFAEVVKFMNSGASISNEVRDKMAKHVADIGNFGGYLTDQIKEEFSTIAFRYWLTTNQELQDAIIVARD